MFPDLNIAFQYFPMVAKLVNDHKPSICGKSTLPVRPAVIDFTLAESLIAVPVRRFKENLPERLDSPLPPSRQADSKRHARLKQLNPRATRDMSAADFVANSASKHSAVPGFENHSTVSSVDSSLARRAKAGTKSILKRPGKITGKRHRNDEMRTSESMTVQKQVRFAS